MDVDELTVALGKAGYKIVDAAVNKSGQMVYYIAVSEGRRVAMFHRDAVDLVRGEAAIEDIISRNVNADLAEPWPLA